MTEETIPNWTFFGAGGVSIEVLELPCENCKVNHYQSSITFFLDDGQERIDNPLVVTIETDIMEESAEAVALRTFSAVGPVFYNISPTVMVLNEKGDINREISLPDLLNPKGVVH